MDNRISSAQIRRKPISNSAASSEPSPQQRRSSSSKSDTAPKADPYSLPALPFSRNHDAADGEALLENDSTHSSTNIQEDKTDTPKEKGISANGVASSVQSWAWELLCCVFIIGVSCAIIAVLIKFNHQPLHQLPFKVSLNALISLLSTALKASLIVPIAACIGQLKWTLYQRPHRLLDISLYDSASRGPWGAFTLLYSAGKPRVVWIGAMLTVLAIAIDPFTQQIIRYRPCATTYSNSTTAVIRAQNYSVFGTEVGTGSQPDQRLIDLDMQAAFFQGAYGASINPNDLLTQCETGNCSFPQHQSVAYQSLGICHKCADISYAVISYCSNLSSPLYYDKRDCNYTLPLRHGITDGSLGKDNDTSQFGPSLRFYQDWSQAIVMNVYPENGYSQLWPGQTDHFHSGVSLNDTNSVGKFAYLAFSYYPNTTMPEEVAVDPVAVECGMYPCIRSYGASVEGGLLKESIVDTQFLEWPNMPYVNLDAIASNCVVNGKPVDASGITISYQDVLDSNTALGVTVDSPNITGVTEANKQCLYHLDNRSIYSLKFFFRYLFLGVVDDNSKNGVGAAPEWLSVLWNGGRNSLNNTDTIMSKVAKSITQLMRQKASVSPQADGQVWFGETCVEVQWAWLSLHAILVVFCFVFLAVTIMISARQARGRLWKSSPLALMYHGFDSDIAKRVSKGNKVDEIEDDAKRQQVRLAYTNHGWKFVDQSS